MDVESRLVLYTVVLGAAIGIAQLVKRRARDFLVYQFELALLLGVSVTALLVRGWTAQLAWPAFYGFCAVAIVPPTLLDGARRAARARRFGLAAIGSGTAAVLLGGPAPLRRERAVYAAMAAAERGDPEDCRRRLEHLAGTLGIPPTLGGDALIRILPAATRRDWSEVLAVLDATPVQSPTLLVLEARAASETGDLVRAVRACREIDSIVPEPSPARWTSRRAVLAAAGRVRFLSEAVARRLPVVSGPAGAADLALARAHEALGDGGAASVRYDLTIRRARGSVRLDAEDGVRRCRVGTLLVAPKDPALAAALDLLESECRAEPPVPATGALLARAPFIAAATAATALASVAVFYAVGMDGVSLLAAGALSAPLVRADGQWWRLASAILLHGGWVHLVMNLASILFVGIPLERHVGWARTALVYVVAGLTGSLASVVLASTDVGVGASGAAMGLIGALLVLLLRRGERFPAEDRRRYIAALAITVGATFLVGLVERESIDNTAHAAGLLGGAAAALLLLQRGREPAWLAPALRLAALAACGLVVAAGLRAARESRDWAGERTVTVEGARAEVPRWMRLRRQDDHSIVAALPMLGFAAEIGAAPAVPDVSLVVPAGARHAALLDGPPSVTLPPVDMDGTSLEITEYREADGSGLRVHLFRRGAAFVLVADEMGPGGATEGDVAAIRIGRSLEAVE